MAPIRPVETRTWLLPAHAALPITCQSLTLAQANILFAVALQERVKGERIYVNSLHPGVIHTTLIRGPVASYGMFAVRPSVSCLETCCSHRLLLQKIANKVEPMFLMTPKEGAKTQIYLAASPEVVKENYRLVISFVPDRSL